MHAPMFDGNASSFANYEEKVTLRNQIPTIGPQRRAANLFLRMTDVARMVCMSARRDAIGNADGAAHILRILRERFAPDAFESIFQDEAKSMYLKRTDQSMGASPMEFDMLRR